MLRFRNFLLPLAVTLFIVLPTLNAFQDYDAKQNNVGLKDEDSSSMKGSLMNGAQVAYMKELSHLSRQKRGKGCKLKRKCKKSKGECSQTRKCQSSERQIKKGCRGKTCKCCAPGTPGIKCEAQIYCRAARGSCVEKKKACKSGFIISGDGACKGKKCYCCIPASDHCSDELSNWTPPTDLQLPGIDTLVSLNCVSYLELIGCLTDFTPCINKVVECAPELIDHLLPEDAPKDCIQELIDQSDIELLLDEIYVSRLSSEILNKKGLPGYEAH